jgi:phage regulator Rha-like protein
MNDLVKIIHDVPVVSTLDMWESLEVKHKALMDMIRKNENEFQEIRLFTFQKSKGTGGRPSEFCYLDEEQATFLIVLMKNSPVVKKFKFRLTREFFRLKKVLADIAAQRQNAQWLDQRKAGIPVRIKETDTIQKFVEYATLRGSINAIMYYANISKMQNKALFFIEQKFKNIRDILNLEQLSTVVSADKIVTKALDDGMAADMPYREIYQLAKSRIETFSEIHGKTLIPNLSGQKQITSEKGR